MDIKKLSPDLSVSGQISAADVAELATLGFRSIVCNRPDGETPDQPSAAEIRKAAEDHGLTFYDLPVISGQVTDADGAAFRQALSALPHPVFAYCRTGTRSTVLWALAEAQHQPADAILRAARDAGYDLSALRPRLETAAHKAS